MSQRAYIDMILKRFDRHNCSTRSVPITKGERLSKDQCPKNDTEMMAMKNVRYSSVVGSLMYAQVCTRPDIAFFVGVLDRFMSNPGFIHYQAVKKVFRYLQGIKDHMLTYRRTNSLDVVCYSDVDFKGCVDDKKFTTGYIFVMTGGVVSWRSAKQSVTTSLTMKAEYVACYKATRHVVWLRNFIHDLGVVDSIERPIMMYCDNNATISFSNNLKGIPGARYIDVKYFFSKGES